MVFIRDMEFSKMCVILIFLIWFLCVGVGIFCMKILCMELFGIEMYGEGWVG